VGFVFMGLFGVFLCCVGSDLVYLFLFLVPVKLGVITQKTKDHTPPFLMENVFLLFSLSVVFSSFSLFIIYFYIENIII